MTSIPVPPLSIRDKLRESTDRAHRESEALWAPDGYFQSRTRYLGFLKNLLQVHETLGLPAAEVLGDPDDQAEERARIAHLRTDLGTTQDAAVPRALDASDAWGVAYVLHGASLGAAMILKHGGLAPDWPRAYMTRSAAYAQSGQLRAFFDRLNAAPANLTAATNGANAAFAMLRINKPATT